MPNNFHPHGPFTKAEIVRLSDAALEARLNALGDVSDEDPELVEIEAEIERREYDASDPSA